MSSVEILCYEINEDYRRETKENSIVVCGVIENFTEERNEI